MFLRRHKRRKSSETYEYWTLVKPVRTARGPRQRTVATLGKLPGLDDQTRVGWEHVAEILDGKKGRVYFPAGGRLLQGRPNAGLVAKNDSLLDRYHPPFFPCFVHRRVVQIRRQSGFGQQNRESSFMGSPPRQERE